MRYMLKWIFLPALVVVFGLGFFFWNFWNNNSPVDVRDNGATSSTTVAVSNTSLQNPTITMGTPEVLFHFGTSTAWGHCPGLYTDMRLAAFRRDDGKVDLFVSNSKNYAFVGNTVDTAVPDADLCTHIFVPPTNSANPADYHQKMWLKGAVMTPQGDIIGVIHNEYHGESYGDADCIAAQGGDPKIQPCWYVSSLIALSHDGGKTFDTSSTKPLAMLPFKYQPLMGRTAYSSPYILSHRNGDTTPYMYVFFNAGAPTSTPVTKSGKNGTCIMRGTSADPSTWRMWGGTDFDVTVANPYTTVITDPVAHMCEPVLPSFLFGAVKYIPSQGVYIALGTKQTEVVYTVSRDLIHWTAPAVLTYDDGTSYFSLLDPTSPTRSFETLEGKPYMYYVVRYGDHTSQRKLMRVPLTITFE